jgi:hypothetical protein
VVLLLECWLIVRMFVLRVYRESKPPTPMVRRLNINPRKPFILINSLTSFPSMTFPESSHVDMTREPKQGHVHATGQHRVLSAGCSGRARGPWPSTTRPTY